MLATPEINSVSIHEAHAEPDLAPNMGQVISTMEVVTSETAFMAWRGINKRYAAGNPPQSKEDIEEFAFGLDVEATNVLEKHLHAADFKTNVVASEGLKEKRKYGMVLPIPDGPYGFGSRFPFSERWILNEGLTSERMGDLQVILDPIEGTSKAGRNQEGAIAVVGGSLTGELKGVPKEDGDAHYTDRLIAGGRMKDKIHFDMPTSEIIRETEKAYGLQEGQKVKVYVLDRDRNATLIRELLEAGAEVVPLSGGDLTPALAALKDDQPILSMGSGGKEEAYIAAIAAKAVDGVFEGRYVDKNGVPSKDHPENLTLEHLTPGNPEDYFVNLSSITGNKDLGLGPITPYVNGSIRYKIPTLTITSAGYSQNYTLVDDPKSQQVTHFSDHSVWPDYPADPKDLNRRHYGGQIHRLIAPQTLPKNS